MNEYSQDIGFWHTRQVYTFLEVFDALLLRHSVVLETTLGSPGERAEGQGESKEVPWLREGAEEPGGSKELPWLREGVEEPGASKEVSGLLLSCTALPL